MSTWTNAVAGNWSDASNWTSSVPDGVDAVASITNVTGSGELLAIDLGGVTRTVGQLDLAQDGNTDYEIKNGTVRFQTSSGAATFNLVNSGFNYSYITADLEFASDTNIVMSNDFYLRASRGTWSGSGNVNVSGSGDFTVWRDSLAGLTGTLTIGSGIYFKINTNGSAASIGSSLVTVNGFLGTEDGQRLKVKALAGSGSVGSISGNGGIGNGILEITDGDGKVFSGRLEGSNLDLVKSGTGATYLTGAINNYGSTTINGGVLLMGNGSQGSAGSIGTGGVTINSDGVFALFKPSDFTLANTISGSGRFDKNSAGTATLTADSSGFTGTVKVNAGTLALSGNGSLDGVSKMTIASGAQFDITGISSSYASVGVLEGYGQVAVGGKNLFAKISGTDMRLVAVGSAGMEVLNFTAEGTSGSLAFLDFDTWTDGVDLISLTGSALSQALTGSKMSDVISALGGNDIISAGLGTNTVNGGAGFDAASYGFAKGSATITKNGNGSWTIGNGSTITDTLTGVEVARFSDGNVSLRVRTKADFNGSGISDVLWADGGNTIGQWVSNGAGGVSWKVLGTGSSTVQVAGMGDFDGDGIEDILWQNPNNNYLGIWKSGTTAWQVIGTGSTTMRIAGIGDFNGDGTSDILWQNPANNYVGIWQMDAGAPTWNKVATGSTTMEIAAVGDFNGDGNSDILWRNPTNNLMGMWTMNGNTPSWQMIGQGSTTMDVVGSGDFNGDGTEDILWRNASNGFVGYWAMNNGSPTWHGVGNSSTAFRLAALGDYNGDGTTDILWRNNANGDVGMWTMSNGTPTWKYLSGSGTSFGVVS